jgi:NDP-sugar pyrophosphorylase family protein
LDTWRLNVNSHEDLLKANQLLLAEESYTDFKFVNQNGQPHTFQIIPPIFIGKNVRIASNAIIGPHVTLERNAIVGEGTRIKNSVLLPRANVGKNCFIVNTVLGENSHVGDDVHTSEEKSVALILGDNEKLIPN